MFLRSEQMPDNISQRVVNQYPQILNIPVSSRTYSHLYLSISPSQKSLWILKQPVDPRGRYSFLNCLSNLYSTYLTVTMHVNPVGLPLFNLGLIYPWLYHFLRYMIDWWMLRLQNYIIIYTLYGHLHLTCYISQSILVLIIKFDGFVIFATKKSAPGSTHHLCTLSNPRFLTPLIIFPNAAIHEFIQIHNQQVTDL